MTLDEEVEKAVCSLSEEEAYEFLKGVANGDVVLVTKMFWRGLLRLPEADIDAFLDVAFDDEAIVNVLKSNIHLSDSLKEEAKSVLEE